MILEKWKIFGEFLRKFAISGDLSFRQVWVIISIYKPVSFLVVGKRKTGKSLCARHLSSEWGAKARFLIGSFYPPIRGWKMKSY